MSNLSIRGRVQAEKSLLAGFTIPAGPERTVLVRVAGPALATFGLSDALIDPKLELLDGRGIKRGENDNFTEADAVVAASVGAFPFAAGGKDAALIASLAPGSYTVQASGVGGATGMALVEIYDLSHAGGRLSNLSSRTQLTAADSVVIAGFTVAPVAGTRRFLIRAVGAALRAFDVASPLWDPQLEVFAGSRKIAENDNWARADAANENDFFALSAAFADSGAFPLVAGSTDAAVLLDLPAGTYSMQVRGSDRTGGAVLLEAYEIPPPPNTGVVQTVANLEVRQFTVARSSDGYFLWYSPRLQLAETTGRGAAIVVSIKLRLEGTLWYGPDPSWAVRMPIAAGGSAAVVGWDPNGTVSDDLGLGIEGGPLPASGMTATITYRVGDGSDKIVSGSWRAGN
jgi:hypothetical protein